MARVSVVSVAGFSSSSCGYCAEPGKRSPAKSSKSFYLVSHALDPAAYQLLIDAGWRRSGKLLYKPDNSRTCCPQHPIRLPIDDFQASRSQRRAIKPLFWAVHAAEDGSRPRKKPGVDNEPFDLESFWRHTEWRQEDGTGAIDGGQHGRTTNRWYRLPKQRRLEISLRPATVSQGSYDLYKKYQMTVHKDTPEKVPMQQWQRFLVSNSFMTGGEVRKGGVVDLDSPEPIPYGGYHQEWRLDGKLIAVGVVDILPSCVSSVYLYYDPEYEHLNLGKASALREIYLVRQLQRKRGMGGVQFYYLGYWIAMCPKMVYKAEYRPQQVLDTATGEWVALQQVRPAIEAGVHYSFARYDGKPVTPSSESSQTGQNAGDQVQDVDMDQDQDEDEDEDDSESEDDEPFLPQIPTPLPPGVRPPTSLPRAEVDQALVFDPALPPPARLIPLGRSSLREEAETREKVLAALCVLGAALAPFFAIVT